MNALDLLFHEYRGAPFSVRTPQWQWASVPSRSPAFSLVFRNIHALGKLLSNPTELSLGEAFIQGDLDVEGDLFAAFEMANHVFSKPLKPSVFSMLLIRRTVLAAVEAMALGREHCVRRDRSAISYHYDRPPEFFRSWLGPTMAYSCAYFRDPTADLDTAQADKMELICRKLDLQKSDTFLDIGCGWGSLALHAASRYGAHVRGITLSKKQAQFASAQIAETRMGPNCFVETRDYRDLPQLPYRYDKVASVGMFEHVGRKNLPRYFRIAHEILKPGGLFLNHGIGRTYGSNPARFSFMRQYVFPDGELVPLTEAIQHSEAAGFEVRDVENLREHYAQTLRLWVANLQKSRECVLSQVPEITYRIWLLYMSACSVAFQNGEIAVYQLLLRRPNSSAAGWPSTREHWYKTSNRSTPQITRAA